MEDWQAKMAGLIILVIMGLLQAGNTFLIEYNARKARKLKEQELSNQDEIKGNLRVIADGSSVHRPHNRRKTDRYPLVPPDRPPEEEDTNENTNSTR